MTKITLEDGPVKTIADFFKKANLIKYFIEDERAIKESYKIQISDLLNFKSKESIINFLRKNLVFTFDNIGLESLFGSPEEVDKFIVSNNNITSLKYSPKIVNEFFECGENKLTSLEFGPEIVNGNYLCDFNELTSLKGSPKEVGGNFDCSFNNLFFIRILS